MKDFIKNKYDFTIIFDVTDGNPNGDPDNGNAPRMDMQTGYGLVSDVCIKRKLRNYIQVTKNTIPGCEILIKQKSFDMSEDDKFINTEIENAISSGDSGDLSGYTDEMKQKIMLCRKFYDTRMFGQTVTLKKNTAQIRGAAQIYMARSVDPIYVQEHCISICMPRDPEKSITDQIGLQGRKYTIPYGLYVCHGNISAFDASKNGVTEDDVELLWESICNMFVLDHSAARGKMCMRKLIIFKHSSLLGNASDDTLHKLIKIKRKNQDNDYPRSYDDYEVCVDENNIPAGVTVEYRTSE